MCTLLSQASGVVSIVFEVRIMRRVGEEDSCLGFHEEEGIKLNVSFPFIACFYSQVSQAFKG